MDEIYTQYDDGGMGGDGKYVRTVTGAHYPVRRRGDGVGGVLEVVPEIGPEVVPEIGPEVVPEIYAEIGAEIGGPEVGADSAELS